MPYAQHQRINDKIRAFPAFPADTSLVSRCTPLAKGGFLVTSEREAKFNIDVNSVYVIERALRERAARQRLERLPLRSASSKACGAGWPPGWARA
jgi:hypothetical protein